MGFLYDNEITFAFSAGIFVSRGYPGVGEFFYVSKRIFDPALTQTALNKKSTHNEMSQVPVFAGGAEGDRTPDLMTASHALSHLSYSPSKIVFHSRKCLLVSI